MCSSSRARSSRSPWRDSVLPRPADQNTEEDEGLTFIIRELSVRILPLLLAGLAVVNEAVRAIVRGLEARGLLGLLALDRVPLATSEKVREEGRDDGRSAC